MQRNLLKCAAFAALALALASVPAGAMQAGSTFAAATPQLSTLPANDDVSRFYNASKNAPIWFRAGQVCIARGAEFLDCQRSPPLEERIGAVSGQFGITGVLAPSQPM